MSAALRAERDALAARIAAFVDAPAGGAPLTALMLDVHRWQRAHDPVVRALTVGEPQRIDEIPAVPVDVWKDLPVGTIPADEPLGADAATFLTSGTTSGRRGTHRMRSVELYDKNALSWARTCVGDWPTNVVALLDDALDSSLGHMARLFGDVAWYARGGIVDVDRAARHLADGRPAYVVATAFALAEYVQAAHVGPLPPGSLLMVTGGFKGRVHKLDGEALLARTLQVLRPARLVTEYGMTELSSQLWGRPGGPFVPPPWLVPVAVDPVTGRVLPRGERGQLRFYDLCNLDSSVGVETMDEGIVTDTGVQLFGRLPGAPARGCSLTVEEAWEKR